MTIYRFYGILIYRKRETNPEEKKGNHKMRTYYIYNAETDETEYLGSVQAYSITDAELKASKELNTNCEIYALTTAPGEAWA